MVQTCARSARAILVRVDSERRHYEVSMEVRTLVRRSGAPRVEERVVDLLYQLHPEHPFVPPLAVARQRGLFNPHLHDPEARPDLAPVPLLCLGAFEPRMRLADWVLATYDVLGLRRVAPESPLNEEAAAWVREQLATPGALPLDRRSFWREDAPSVAAPSVAPVTAAGPESLVRFRTAWRAP